MAIQHIQASLHEAHAALESLLLNKDALASIERAADFLIDTFERKGRVYSCGNGGSMCDAMHFAEELTGRYRQDRAALAAAAISDPGHMSCVGNDLGYEYVYICTPAGSFADRIQELHIKVLHILIELVERHFFTANYQSGD